MKNINTLEDLGKVKKIKAVKTQYGKIDHEENDFLSEVAEKAREAKKSLASQEKSHIKFPFHVFPKVMQDLLTVFYESSGFAPEYYFSNLLSVTALCISNKYRIRAKSDFVQPAILYMVNMGKSGLGKSGPQKSIFMPIFKIQKEKISTYNETHKSWLQEQAEAKADKVPFDQPEPMLQKVLFEYATVEALWEIITHCQHGFSLVDDEISGWVEAMGQYSNSKGPEVAFWLKNYDNPALISIYRKGQPDKFIYNSCVNINGNIQPDIVKKLADGDNSSNGFFARFLITIPSKETVNDWNEVQPDITVFQKYEEIIKFMYDLPSKIPDNIPHFKDVERIDFNLSPEAKIMYVKYYNDLANRMNGESDDKIFSQLSKFRGTCLRFALVMDMLHFTCSMFDNDEWNFKASKKEKLEYLQKHQIAAESMKAAITLTEYYIQTSMNVLSRFDNILNTYKPEIRAWYKELPERFKSAYAVELGQNIGFSKASVYNYLKDKNLFKKNAADSIYYKVIEI